MIIAVTYENGEVFQHFGRTQQFLLCDVEDGKVKSEKVIGTDGRGHGALAGVLLEQGVDVLICGGIGGGARTALDSAGILLIPGASGSASDAVREYLNGTLYLDPDAGCGCPGHEEGHGHECGEDRVGHGCHE